MSPITSHKDPTTMDIVRRFAAKKAIGQSSGLTKHMIPKPPKTFLDLARLCLIFSELELFLWLQRKFPPGNMIEQQAASAMRERAIEYISDGLNNVRNKKYSRLKNMDHIYSHETHTRAFLLSQAEELHLTHCYVKRDRGIREKWTASQSKNDDMEEEFNDWNDSFED